MRRFDLAIASLWAGTHAAVNIYVAFVQSPLRWVALCLNVLFLVMFFVGIGVKSDESKPRRYASPWKVN